MRQIPQSPDAEWCLLGCFFLDATKSFEEVPLLSPEWFYSEVNQEVARSISNVFQKGIAVDYLSVAADIRARVPAVSTGTTGNIDSLLVGMADAVPTVANLGFYQAQVKESWRRRKIILACTDTVTSAYKTDEDIASVEEKFQRMALEVVSEDEEALPLDARKLIQNFWNRNDERGLAKGIFPGVRTGLQGLDRMLGGFRPGSLIIMAGRPAMGKTAIMTTIGPRIATRGAMEASLEDGAVVFFSLEMTKEQLIDRIVATLAKLDLYSLESNALVEDEWVRMREATALLYDSRLVVIDKPDLTVPQMIGLLRRIQARRKLCAVFVDYLQIITTGNAGREPENVLVGRNAIGLKLMARLFNIPVLCASQINRNVESRENKRPNMSDLAESGKIEAAADAVIFPFRPGYYDRAPLEEGFRTQIDYTKPELAELIVAKNRFGPTGVAKATFTPAYTCFDDIPERRF